MLYPYQFGFEDVGHPDVAFVPVSEIQVVERKTDPKIGTRDPGNDGALEAPGQSWDVCMPCLVPVLKHKQCRSEGHDEEQGWGQEFMTERGSR